MLTSWSTPATQYPSKRLGKAEITSTKYNGLHDAYGIRKPYKARNLTIRVLTIDGEVWMVDDPPHWWSIQDRAASLSGHVLCAGLGLGLIVHALHTNPKVSRITVVERERDVIDLVGPLLPQEKLEIVHDDFWNWRGKVDGVFFDLFVGDGRELVGHALRAYILLFEQFGDIPIHILGFPFCIFEELHKCLANPAGVLFRVP
jgi:hypothetical protein